MIEFPRLGEGNEMRDKSSACMDAPRGENMFETAWQVGSRVASGWTIRMYSVLYLDDRVAARPQIAAMLS